MSPFPLKNLCSVHCSGLPNTLSLVLHKDCDQSCSHTHSDNHIHTSDELHILPPTLKSCIMGSYERPEPLRLGSKAPNFKAETTAGPIDFHEWAAGGWVVLFSHPEDYT